MYRLFVAVDLPEAVRQELAGFCCGIPGAKWVAPEQLHLTLRFIGEVDGDVFRDIRSALADIRSPAFAMTLKGFGCFPPRKAPRVLWVGVEDNEALTQLRNRVESSLVRVGLEPERRKFSPHITLARLRETPLGKLTKFLAGNGLYRTAAFPVDEFHLYSSTLTPKGAIHTCEESYRLEA